jgi:galactose-1-phosphate uridylyltransferase
LDEKQLNKLAERISAASTQQCRVKAVIWRRDPITGRQVLINQLRASRHFEVSSGKQPEEKRREDCFFCTGRTPSTLFYVDESGRVVIEEETKSLEKAKEFWEQQGRKQGNLPDHYALVGALGGITLPERWRARTFFNLTPGLGEEDGNCYVTAAHPAYHYRDLADMPPAIVDAVIASWQVLEKSALAEGRIAVPFINGGKRPESGQSVSCFHSQTYVMNPPALYLDIAERRKTEGCPVCEVMHNDQWKDLFIKRVGRVWIGAYPAPVRNFSFLIAVESDGSKCPARISDLPENVRMDLAESFRMVIQTYRQMFGEIPAYNIAVRCGDEVGHLHAEVIPKTRTNIPAGFEDATLTMALSERPENFAAIAREEMSAAACE